MFTLLCAMLVQTYAAKNRKWVWLQTVGAVDLALLSYHQTNCGQFCQWSISTCILLNRTFQFSHEKRILMCIIQLPAELYRIFKRRRAKPAGDTVFEGIVANSAVIHVWFVQDFTVLKSYSIVLIWFTWSRSKKLKNNILKHLFGQIHPFIKPCRTSDVPI